MALILSLTVGGCSGGASTGNAAGQAAASGGRASDAKREHPLDSLHTATITVNDKPVKVWLALTDSEQLEGLMHVPPEELPDDQGMLFVFSREEPRGFWMRNTITALDIAYMRSDGRVVKIHQMPPLTLQTFPSGQPAIYALEMKAGAFQKLGLKTADRIVIPPDLSKASP